MEANPQLERALPSYHPGKIFHEKQYFADPFEVPAWRKQWLQQTA